MLVPDFLLFLIKQAETVKPLRNTTGFTNVCIFICQFFNIKEVKETVTYVLERISCEKTTVLGNS